MQFQEKGPNIIEFKYKLDSVLNLVQSLSKHIAEDKYEPTLKEMKERIIETSLHKEEFLIEYDSLLDFYHSFKNKAKNEEEKQEFAFIEDFWTHVEPGITFFKIVMDQIPSH